MGAQRQRRRGWAAAISACLLASTPVLAQQTLSTGTVMEAVERLKPGQFIWAPQAAPAGPLMLIVSLATQRAVLYRNGVPIGVTTVSTGRPGYPTPSGVFTILQKDVEHFSSIYDNAPMPYMQRLTWGGVALHAGQLPGYPASHGCIRLPLDFAKQLYGVTALGMTVVVTTRQALPRVAPAPQLSADPGELAGGSVEWHPERSPSGPVSIVVSGSDRRVVVLRNGQVIGSAPVDFDDPIGGTQIYLLQSIAGETFRWTRFDIGQAAAEPAPAPELRRFRVSDAFRLLVKPIIVPGTTIVITADSLRTPEQAAALLQGD